MVILLLFLAPVTHQLSLNLTYKPIIRVGEKNFGFFCIIVISYVSIYREIVCRPDTKWRNLPISWFNLIVRVCENTER